jgi:hypothetical protein
MSHKSINALCVGGPLDGKMLQHNGAVYKMPVRRDGPIPASRVDYTTGDTKPLETFTYIIYGIDGRWLWAREGQSLGEVLETLLDAYWQYRALDD